MPRLKLTQAAVDKLRAPSSGRAEYWDSQLPGFGLRISASPGRIEKEGRRTWQVMYRVKGKLVRETLGTVFVIPKVDEARDRARASMRAAQSGVNPVEARRTKAADVAKDAMPRPGLPLVHFNDTRCGSAAELRSVILKARGLAHDHAEQERAAAAVKTLLLAQIEKKTTRAGGGYRGNAPGQPFDLERVAA